MPEYDPSRGKVNILGSLVSVERAKRMVSELESAIEDAEFHSTLDDNVKYNDMALKHLMNPSEDDYILIMEVSTSLDGVIPLELFEEVLEDRELDGHDMRITRGQVEARKISRIHEKTEEPISFEVSIP